MATALEVGVADDPVDQTSLGSVAVCRACGGQVHEGFTTRMTALQHKSTDLQKRIRELGMLLHAQLLTQAQGGV